MPLQPYSTGTVGVTNGSTAVAGGTGVAWLPALVVQGDWLIVPAQGAFGIIESVNDTYDGITLYEPWSGATAFGLDYLILPLSWQRFDPALTQATTRALLALLSGAGIIYYVPAGQSPDPGLATTNGQLAVQVASGLWSFWVSESGAWVSLPPPGASRAQRSITGSGGLPIRASDGILNINVSAPLAITVPAASTRAGAPLTFKNLPGSQLATLNPTGADTFDGMSTVPVAAGAGVTLVPYNDGVNAGYAIE